MLSVQSLSKGFGDQLLFDQATFSILSGEKVGIVGQNGHGKTTLLNMIVGKVDPDGGMIQFPSQYRIGYLDQHRKFEKSTVIEEACYVSKDELVEPWTMKKILSGLGFSESDFEKSPEDLSGGFQVRLKLGRVLACQADMLLLDEPTNFLDIISIRWLVRFISSYKGEIIVVSHDRYFLNQVVTHILGIYRRKVKKFKGNTDNYFDHISLEDEVYEKRLENQLKQRKKMEDFVRKFRAKARQANLAQSRLKALNKQHVGQSLEAITHLSFNFNYRRFSAKTMIDVRDISFRYGSNLDWLFQKLSFSVLHGEKVAIIGRNGKGKSTLIKNIMGELEPLEGELSFHPKTDIGYYEQTKAMALSETQTIEDCILEVLDPPERKRARDICGAMMFSGDSALKLIRVLSGGERCRVLIGRLLACPSNLLILDEPTHHLDLSACEALADAMKQFEGGLLFVSHDEYLLHQVATKLVVFEGQDAFVFDGTYQEFLDQIGWREETGGTDVGSKPGNVQNKKEDRKRRAQFVQEKSKLLNPVKKHISSLEKKITVLEKEKKELMDLLLECSQNGLFDDATKLSKKQQQLDVLIEENMTQWEDAQFKMEEISAQFEKGLNENES